MVPQRTDDLVAGVGDGEGRGQGGSRWHVGTHLTLVGPGRGRLGMGGVSADATDHEQLLDSLLMMATVIGRDWIALVMGRR